MDETPYPRHRIPKGPSAYRIYGWAFVVTSVFVVLMLYGLAVLFFDPHGPLRVSAMITMLLAFVAQIGYLTWGDMRNSLEAVEGYTTLPRQRKHLVQRDPYLGEIVRDAGQEYMERQEFLEMCERAKAKYAHMHSG